MKPVLILGPMDCEIDRIEAEVQNAEISHVGGFRFTSGSIGGVPVVVCRCLIGMVNSAAATVLAAQKFDPGCVILQGTAGAHDPALTQGDVVLGKDLKELGCFCTAHRDPGEGVDLGQWEVKGEELLRNGKPEFVKTLHSDAALLETALKLGNPHGRLLAGTIGSADIWNRELDRIRFLHETLGTDCEEMEGFAVAQVCDHLGLPLLVVRVISNSEWRPEEEFDEALAAVSQQFTLRLLASSEVRSKK